ncbi:hypothetical protein J6A31_09135 [bacterium]|nr:hypothetical protein [bacterium]
MSMSKILEIEFVFENCEGLTIDGSHLNYLSITDVRPQYHYSANSSFIRMDIAHEICIQINSDGNGTYYPFNVRENAREKFDRITKFDDISQINLTIGEADYVPHKEIISITPIWTGDDDMTNAAQTSRINEDGSLQIVIKDSAST